ncbi:MAG: glycine cleavage system protein GcvH [Acidaminococcaceae bacterium]|nr:glycine cleavage system protein GcvH [Acidaminococcaceae bacterium]HAY60972.1 glycine cleavage system protein GcvH [Acidaminococcaceae bacterium]HCJ90804.1 glycine cleavage system protein GcvH [Acidaminococcaceae bacterium]
MAYATDRKYTKTHEWVKTEGGTAAVGITDYAQEQLGALVFVNLPMEGDSVTAGEPLGDVESVKAVSDIISPVTGTVAAINETLLDHPERVNSDPDEAWFIKVSDVTDTDELLDAAAYEAFVEEEKAKEQ